jgi:hypothetical protein
MCRLFSKGVFLAFSLLFVATYSAVATSAGDDSILIERFKNWSVYKSPSGTYFMAARAAKQSGTYGKRGDPYLMVTNFGNDGVQISVYTGYTYKVGSTVSGVVYMSSKDSGKVESFVMYSQGERAWFKNKDDAMMIEKFKLGYTVELNGESHRGTFSKDLYSLDGFSDAYRSMMSKSTQN